MNNMKEEIWKVIPSYPNYEASNTGKIRNKSTGKVLKPNTNSKGYHHVVLYNGSKKDKHVVGVHRAVAMAFLPTNNYSLTVNHKDENPDNNNIDNLEWIENSDNIRYSQGHKVMCLETKKIYSSIWEASRDTGISCKTIRNYLKNYNYKRSRRSKYTWKYVNKE